MKSCLNAATLRQGLAFEQFVRAAGRAGFKGVELRYPAWVELARERGVEGLRRLLDEAGVEAACFGYPASLMRVDSWDADLASAREAARLAAELGVPGGMTVLPFRRGQSRVPEQPEMVDKLRALADLAAEHGRELFLEFIGLYPPPADRVDRPQTVPATLELIRRIDRPNVGLVVDAFHWYLRGTAADLGAIPAGTPIFCHVDDAPPGDREALTDAMRVLPGEGVIDLPAFLAALRATGWDGFVSLELFGEELRALEPVEAARRSLAALRRIGVD
jgi:sugar phosphate isomerase/epimerase